MNKNQTTGKENCSAPGLAVSGGRRIYFVRHGVTEWNKLYRYQGAADIPLCEEGILQAKRAATRMSSLCGVEKIISSPPVRSRTTASCIADSLGFKNVELWNELTEINFGAWEGLTVNEIVNSYGNDFYSWKQNPLHVTATNGEPHEVVFARAVEAAERISRAERGNLVVVGHGAFFRTLFSALLSGAKDNIFWKMRLDNCSISAIDIDSQNNASIVFYNDTLHIKSAYEAVASLPLL